MPPSSHGSCGLRWVALSAQLLSIPPALAFQLLEPRLLPVFLGVIAALASVNVLTWAGLRKRRSVGAAVPTPCCSSSASTSRRCPRCSPSRAARGTRSYPSSSCTRGSAPCFCGGHQSPIFFAAPDQLPHPAAALLAHSTGPRGHVGPRADSLSRPGIGRSGVLDSHRLALSNPHLAPAGIHPNARAPDPDRSAAGGGRSGRWAFPRVRHSL